MTGRNKPIEAPVERFGHELLRTRDLDPVYVVLHEAALEPELLRRWLLAYWCFYHVGTASWIVERGQDYWDRMFLAAGSKEYPRSAERRHFRGAQATDSVSYLRTRGLFSLFRDLELAGSSARQVIQAVRTWRGFGPWIAFKVADMIERLGVRHLEFPMDVVLYDSPRKAAELLHEREGRPDKGGAGVGEWAVGRLLKVFGDRLAPPGYERPVGVQEVETILCKWGSHVKGHYEVGEDVEAVHRGLGRFPGCPVSARLLDAGRRRGLWD